MANVKQREEPGFVMLYIVKALIRIWLHTKLGQPKSQF